MATYTVGTIIILSYHNLPKNKFLNADRLQRLLNSSRRSSIEIIISHPRHLQWKGMVTFENQKFVSPLQDILLLK